ncbi:MAG: gluconate 2-dehydrogenase subunit 3 family protein [Bryobacteraceae bacterium]
MADRRESLKIIGAIGTTCAFPFAADELYGQHAHPPANAETPVPRSPRFFSGGQWDILTRLTDLIIPPTGTPGAAAAGVPQYIDDVVTANREHQRRFQEGLAWLESESATRFKLPFLKLTEDQQIALLQPLSDAVDAKEAKLTPEAQFFRVLKNMTADGYYTSRIGLVDELGYRGNTVLPKFPECHEH